MDGVVVEWLPAAKCVRFQRLQLCRRGRDLNDKQVGVQMALSY